MKIDHNPVFFGKVTNKKGMTKTPSNAAPEFHAGYQTGIDISMPSDFTPLKNAALSGGMYLHGKDVTITFDSLDTGYLTIKEGTAAAQRVLISAYAPNGAIIIDSANLHIKGVFKGQLTIAVQSRGVSGKGDIILDSSLVYSRNPNNHPGSPDILGLCAENDIIIADNANNNTVGDLGIDIQAALFSLKAGLTVENYNSGGRKGTIRLVGGISQNQRGAVGNLATDGSGSLANGYYKNYRYDDRLMNQSPPYFPTTGSYEILSWYER
jgi:hypothetical protein